MLFHLLKQTLNSNQSQGRASTAATDRKRSHKLADPRELNKRGQEPLYEHWRTQMEGKYQTNSDYFDTEQDKINYVYNRTLGDALKHLTLRMKPTAINKWQSAKEMIDHLALWFTDPNKQLNS